MKTQILHQLQYPFSYLLNPYAEEMEEEIERWINTFQMLDDAHRSRIRKARFGYIAARFFPAANYRHLIVQALIMIWFFVHDDIYEHSSVDELEKVHRRFIDTMKGEIAGGEQDELCKLIVAVRRVLVEDMSPAWMERFTGNLSSYLQAVRQEAPYRIAKIFPGQADYMKLREYSIGMCPTMDMIELILGQELPVVVLQHTVIKRLEQLACMLVAMVNDLFSVNRELERKDVINLVLIIQHENACSLEDAGAEVLSLHASFTEEFRTLRINLPNFGSSHKLVLAFLRELEALIIGNLNWHVFDTARYSSSE